MARISRGSRNQGPDIETFMLESEMLIAGICPLKYYRDPKKHIARIEGSGVTIFIPEKICNDIIQITKLITCPLCIVADLFPIIEIESDDLILMKCIKCRSKFSVIDHPPFVHMLDKA